MSRRYGVCSGYIVSQGANADQKLPHYDVIVYDQLEAPTLWTEEHPDVANYSTTLGIAAKQLGDFYLDLKQDFARAEPFYQEALAIAERHYRARLLGREAHHGPEAVLDFPGDLEGVVLHGNRLKYGCLRHEYKLLVPGSQCWDPGRR